MDKMKTGALIKEARIKKNYTQSELGDLLGVSNKAVSRWEKGESFPDVGLLENLATTLDLRIQEIVTGIKDEHDEAALIEIIRAAKLQQRENKRKNIRHCLQIVPILCCILSGFSALGNNSFIFDSKPTWEYVLFMVITFITVVIVYFSNQQSHDNSNKFSTISKLISTLTLLGSVLSTWIILLKTANGSIPFGMEPSSLGPFMNNILVITFTVNLLLLIIQMYRYEKHDEAVHWGWFISIAAIYLTTLYGDCMHNMNTFQGMTKDLIIRTAIVTIVTGISTLCARIYNVKSSNTSF